MRCVSHPHATATRQCTNCQRAFCGLCVKQLTIAERVAVPGIPDAAPARILDVCARCNAPLGEVTQHFRPAPSLANLMSRPFTVEGLISAGALAWLAAGLGWMPGIGSFLTIACYAALIAYYFQIIAHVGEGKSGLPGPSDALHDGAEMWKQTMRGWMCVFVATLPVVVWYQIIHQGKADAPLTAWLLILAGLTYLPAAIVCVVLTNSTWGAIYPVAWIQVVKRAPRSYLQLWALFMLSLAALALLSLVGNLLVGWIPLVGGFLVHSALNLALFAQAALVGGFLMRHAEDFGYT